MLMDGIDQGKFVWCGWQSLLRPNQKTFCNQMDAVMNYMKFRDEKMSVINGQDQKLKAAEKKAADVQERWQKSVRSHPYPPASDISS